jgi:hypothetical protein
LIKVMVVGSSLATDGREQFADITGEGELWKALIGSDGDQMIVRNWEKIAT